MAYQFNNLNSTAKQKAVYDYLKDCIHITDLTTGDVHEILMHADQYEYNKDGTLNNVKE